MSCSVNIRINSTYIIMSLMKIYKIIQYFDAGMIIFSVMWIFGHLTLQHFSSSAMCPFVILPFSVMSWFLTLYHRPQHSLFQSHLRTNKMAFYNKQNNWFTEERGYFFCLMNVVGICCIQEGKHRKFKPPPKSYDYHVTVISLITHSGWKYINFFQACSLLHSMNVCNLL